MSNNSDNNDDIITNLPLEVKREVSAYLSDAELVSTSHVNKQWLQIFTDDLFWKGRLSDGSDGLEVPREVEEVSKHIPMGEYRKHFLAKSRLQYRWTTNRYTETHLPPDESVLQKACNGTYLVLHSLHGEAKAKTAAGTKEGIRIWLVKSEIQLLGNYILDAEDCGLSDITLYDNFLCLATKKTITCYKLDPTRRRNEPAPIEVGLQVQFRKNTPEDYRAIDFQDGKVVIYGYDSGISILDGRTGDLILQCPPQEDDFCSESVNLNGERAYITGYHGHYRTISWDIKNRDKKFDVEGLYKLTGDGKYLLEYPKTIGNDSDTQFRSIDPITGDLIGHFTIPDNISRIYHSKSEQLISYKSGSVFTHSLKLGSNVVSTLEGEPSEGDQSSYRDFDMDANEDFVVFKHCDADEAHVLRVEDIGVKQLYRLHHGGIDTNTYIAYIDNNLMILVGYRDSSIIIRQYNV